MIENEVKPSISDSDRLLIELAKSKKLLAVAEAKAALANSTNADIEYKYLVLKIYMKYNLTADDALNEDGTIILNHLNQGA